MACGGTTPLAFYAVGVPGPTGGADVVLTVAREVAPRRRDGIAPDARPGPMKRKQADPTTPRGGGVKHVTPCQTVLLLVMWLCRLPPFGVTLLRYGNDDRDILVCVIQQL